jgi:hypothetical protein
MEMRLERRHNTKQQHDKANIDLHQIAGRALRIAANARDYKSGGLLLAFCVC